MVTGFGGDIAPKPGAGSQTGTRQPGTRVPESGWIPDPVPGSGFHQFGGTRVNRRLGTGIEVNSCPASVSPPPCASAGSGRISLFSFVNPVAIVAPSFSPSSLFSPLFSPHGFATLSSPRALFPELSPRALFSPSSRRRGPSGLTSFGPSSAVAELSFPS